MKQLNYIRNVSLLLSAFVFMQPARASQYINGSRVVIDRPVYDNIYIIAGYITINAAVHGDVIVAGGRVVINDSVYNDLLVAGGEVELQGFVGDDVRCAGGKIRIHRDIQGDVVLFGGEVEADSVARIGNVYGRAGRLLLNARVSGDVKIYGGVLTLNGIIDGSTDCRAEKIYINGTLGKGGSLAAPGIEAGPAAWFGKKVRFWNRPGKLSSPNPFIEKYAEYDKSLRVEEGHWYYLGYPNFFSMLLYLGMVLVLLSAIHAAFSQTLSNAGRVALHRPFKLLLTGFLYLAGIPLLCILAITSVVGLPLAVVVLALYSLLLLCSGIIFSILLAYLIKEKKYHNLSATRITLTAMAIFAGFKLLQMIPAAGYILPVLAACWTAGALGAALKLKRVQEEASITKL